MDIYISVWGHKFSPIEIELYSRRGISIYICISSPKPVCSSRLSWGCRNRVAADLPSPVCYLRSAGADQTGSINADKQSTQQRLPTK